MAVYGLWNKKEEEKTRKSLQGFPSPHLSEGRGVAIHRSNHLACIEAPEKAEGGTRADSAVWCLRKKVRLVSSEARLYGTAEKAKRNTRKTTTEQSQKLKRSGERRSDVQGLLTRNTPRWRHTATQRLLQRGCATLNVRQRRHVEAFGEKTRHMA